MATGWLDTTRIMTQSWTCGYCFRDVASDVGWAHTMHAVGGNRVDGHTAICPRCDLPSLISSEGTSLPPAKPGEAIEHLPEDVGGLYDEARRALQQNAPTASSMAGRKVLMNVAVANGAPEGKRFVEYVDWLVDNHLVTPPMREWVDEIRELGNDANHEIDLMTTEAATELLTFVAMLLRVVYEYPAKGRRSMEARKARDARDA